MPLVWMLPVAPRMDDIKPAGAQLSDGYALCGDARTERQT